MQLPPLCTQSLATPSTNPAALRALVARPPVTFFLARPSTRMEEC